MNARHACAGNAAVCWRASTVQVALRPITRSRRRSAPRSLSDLALGPSASAAPTGTATFPSYSLQAVDIEQAKQVRAQSCPVAWSWQLFTCLAAVLWGPCMEVQQQHCKWSSTSQSQFVQRHRHSDICRMVNTRAVYVDQIAERACCGIHLHITHHRGWLRWSNTLIKQLMQLEQHLRGC